MVEVWWGAQPKAGWLGVCSVLGHMPMCRAKHPFGSEGLKRHGQMKIDVN